MKSYFLFISLFIFLTAGHALSFQSISTPEGLSNRKVFSIAKDKKGYIWLATRSGLDRYNGETFTHYKYPQKQHLFTENPKGIIHNQQGNIFAFSQRSVCRFCPNKNQFELLHNIHLAPNEMIITIAFSPQNLLYIGTNQGIHIWDIEKNEQNYILPQKHIVFSFAFNNKKCWIGTSKGLFQLKKKKIAGNFEYKLYPQKKLQEHRIQTLFFDKKTNNLWIGTFANGLKIFNITHQKILTSPLTTSHPIRRITAINDSSLWIGIDGSGILQIDRKKRTIKKRFTHRSPERNRLATNNIYDIFPDHNLIWITTYNSGLYVYNTNQIVIKSYTHHEKSKNALANNVVNTTFEDSQKNIWFGTNLGLSKYNPTTKKWIHFLQKKQKGHSVILSIFEDHEHNIWAGGYANDIIFIRHNSDKVEVINIPYKKHRKHYIYSIHEDEEETLWLGGIVNGLTSYHPKSNQFSTYPLRGIQKIISYNADTLLIASNKGLCFFNKKDKKISFVNLRKLKGAKPQQAYPNITGLLLSENKKTIWLGTEQNGVFCYRVQKQKLRHYTTKQGLPSNAICGLEMDNQKRLWVATERGLSCLNLSTQYIQSFYKTDGLLDNFILLRSLSKRKNGNILCGTPKGAFEINPQKYTASPKDNILLRFQQFKLFYKNVTAKDENSPLVTQIDNTKKLHLNYKQNSFAFDFIDLNYTNQGNTHYQWRLKGFDQNWCKKTHQHYAVYTNIQPGEYTFEVKAFITGYEKEAVTRNITVRITPPFWASTAAYIIYFILIAFLLYVSINAYLEHLNNKESEKRIRFFINIAHDIRTPLTLIKAPLDELEEEKEITEEGKHALKIAQRNIKSLLKMVTQLLDFQKIEREAMKLHIEETEINPFIENCLTNFQLAAKEKHIELNLLLPEQKQCGWLDRKKMIIILNNLLSNAIKYTPQRGSITLKASIEENNLTLKVIDNGIGISANEQKKLFKRFYRAENAANSNETGSGIGLLLTQKTVLLHRGTIKVESKENEGTTFTVIIPILKENYQNNEIVKINKISLETSNANWFKEENQADKKIKLLLVDDNEELRHYLKRYLQRNYTVSEAKDGLEALNSIKKEMPDFILSDIMMPNMSGLDLCKHLKADINTCHIPIILLTSLAEKNDIMIGFKSGADDYITKPFELPLLATKIKAIITNRARYRKKYIDKTAIKDKETIANTLDKEFMENVISFIEDNMTNEKFNIDRVASEMAMSRSVFYKKIKSLTGLKPQDLIRDVKMKRAAQLLRKDKYSIVEIAEMSGYPNSKYFSTSFKKYYGYSPTQFLEQEKESED